MLAPPQAERFASLAAVDPGQLVLNVTGWNKLVLLGSDRVFLFPRSAAGVEWFERELAAYRALARTPLSVVPRLLGRWEDPEIYPFPFAAVTRLPGQAPAEAEALLEQLGQAIACWHELEPPALAGARPPRHHDAAHHRWLRRALDPATSADAAAEAAGRLGLPSRAAAWAALLARAAQLGPVLVHGDIHEDQLLADDGQLTGIIDWETARIDHPYWDFDLGERRLARLQHPVGAWLVCLRPDPGTGHRLPPGADRLSPPARASSPRRSRRSRSRWHHRRAPRAFVTAAPTPSWRCPPAAGWPYDVSSPAKRPQHDQRTRHTQIRRVTSFPREFSLTEGSAPGTRGCLGAGCRCQRRFMAGYVVVVAASAALGAWRCLPGLPAR